MRTLVAITFVCALFVACSSSSPENAGPVAEAGTDSGASSGSGGRDATTTKDDGSPPADASVPVDDGSTADAATINSDDAAGSLGTDGSGAEDAQSNGDATPPQDAGQPDGDAGNWKLVCPNSMPPMTCCTMYCGCMEQRCAMEIQGGFPGGKDCMTWCLTVGPTLNRGPVSTGIQFLVCECSEAGNPSVPFDWHSHCEHALGMNGGTCKY